MGERRTAREVRAAADVLGISDHASLHEIRARYRELMKIWHPDVAENESAQAHRMAVRLTESYEVLAEYCMHHRVSLRPEDIRREMDQSPVEYWMKRFGDDPIWG
ncbi:MAG: J domain-containing protein [Methanomicrobiales archaeon]